MPVGPRFHQYSTTNSLWSTSASLNQLHKMRESGLVNAIVRRISSDVARQEFCVKTTNAHGVIEPVEHTFLDLWDRPNDMMTPTGRSFRQLCGTYLELLGEACILVVAAPNGQPVELWPLRPDRLQPVPDPFNWLAGWIYTDDGGHRTPLAPEAIIQLKYPDPVDPYRGLSPLMAAMTDLLGAQNATTWQSNFFENQAIPGGFLTTEQKMTPNEFEIWLKRWDEQHQGTRNAGKVHLMDRGGKFIPQTMSMVDMQLQELVTTSHDRIREAWGISKTMLGATEDVNRATAEAAEYVYSKYTLADRADLWLEAGNELLRRYGTAQAGPGRRSRLKVQLVEDLNKADAATEALELQSKIGAAVALVGLGADPVAVMEAFDLPVLEFTDALDAADVEAPGAGGAPDADTTTAEVDQVAQAKAVAEFFQKIYLAVPKVLERHEVREMARKFGVALDPDLDESDTPDPTPSPPGFDAPQLPPASADDDQDDDDDDGDDDDDDADGV